MVHLTTLTTFRRKPLFFTARLIGSDVRCTYSIVVLSYEEGIPDDCRLSIITFAVAGFVVVPRNLFLLFHVLAGFIHISKRTRVLGVNLNNTIRILFIYLFIF